MLLAVRGLVLRSDMLLAAGMLVLRFGVLLAAGTHVWFGLAAGTQIWHVTSSLYSDLAYFDYCTRCYFINVLDATL